MLVANHSNIPYVNQEILIEKNYICDESPKESVFSHEKILYEVFSDNGPYFDTIKFGEFPKDSDFKPETVLSISYALQHLMVIYCHTYDNFTANT